MNCKHCQRIQLDHRNVNGILYCVSPRGDETLKTEYAIAVSLPVKPGWNKPHSFQFGTERPTWCDVCGHSPAHAIHEISK